MTCPCEDCNEKRDLRWLGALICIACIVLQGYAAWLAFGGWA